jgi:twitching motility two-component system response regulator PilH
MALVLIVDDSPTEQHIIAKMLENHGFETVVASDGREAITVAQDKSPDLILMDVVMEGMDGFKATRELSKDPATASIPVVIVTTKDQESDRFYGLRVGAVAYLTKPFADAELVAAVQANLN